MLDPAVKYLSHSRLISKTGANTLMAPCLRIALRIRGHTEVVMCLAEYLTHNQGWRNASSLHCCYFVIMTVILNNTTWEGVEKTKRYLILEQNFFPITSYITSYHSSWSWQTISCWFWGGKSRTSVSKRDAFPCFRVGFLRAPGTDAHW